MRTTTEQAIECKYCQTTYIQEYYSDNGIDYMGHARGHSTSSVLYDKCPHCQNDVKKAYKIIIDREQRQEQEKIIKLEKLNKIYHKYIVNVRFSTNGKDYTYVSNTKVDEGMYFINKQKGSSTIPNVVIVQNIKEINDSLTLEELTDCEKYQKITLEPITELKTILYEELNKTISPNDIKKALALSQILSNIQDKEIPYSLNKNLEELWWI